MELQCLKRKKPSHPFAQAAVMGSASGSCGHRGGVFGLSPPAPVLRDGRKRRKDKLTWVKHTLTPYFDGHLWRKYGQKVIKDAPYPRLYFRCSYREEASKLVQQVTHDDPPLYEVTYMHEHTCNAEPVPPPDVVADANAMPPPETSGAALVLRFCSSGGGGSGGNHHCGAGMLPQERQPYPYHRHVLHPSPFLMMNSSDDSNSSQLHAFFPPHVVPPAESSSPPFAIIESSSPTPPSTSWCPSFPIESSPTAPSTDNEDDIFSTLDLDSLIYDLDVHSHFSDHVHL